MDEILDHYREREENTRQLAEDAQELQDEIDEEEEELDPARVCWLNLCDDDERCKIICGFGPDEFQEVYDLVEDDIQENIGRGLRSKIPKEDKLLMVLCYLKHYETIDKMKDTFSISKSHLQSLLATTITAIMPTLYDHYVTELQERVEDESEEDQLFPDAKFVMDATFQPIWTPTGTYNEKKRYYSGKHKMYGLKSQCIHDRRGRVVHCIPGERGAVHDLTLCRNNIEEVRVSRLKGCILLTM